MSKNDDARLLRLLQEHLADFPNDATQPVGLARVCAGIAQSDGRSELAQVFRLIAGVAAK
jgi:hypothetical protein